MRIWNLHCVQGRSLREAGKVSAPGPSKEAGPGDSEIWPTKKSHWWRPDLGQASLQPIQELPVFLKVPNPVPSRYHYVKGQTFLNDHFTRIFILCRYCSEIFRYKYHSDCRGGRKEPPANPILPSEDRENTVSDHLLLWPPSSLLLTRNPRWRSHCGSDPGAGK